MFLAKVCLGFVMIGGYVSLSGLYWHCSYIRSLKQRIANDDLHMELVDRITLIEKLTGSPVDLVTHSMGGLLVRSVLARRPQLTSKVASWTALAAPWQGGGARAVEGLVAGYHLGNVLIARSSALRMAKTMPIAFQLLGGADLGDDSRAARQMQSRIDAQPVPHISFSLRGRWQSMSVSSFFAHVTNVSSDDQTSIPFDHQLFEQVRIDRQEWKPLHLPKNFPFFNIYGVGVDVSCCFPLLRSLISHTNTHKYTQRLLFMFPLKPTSNMCTICGQ